MQNVIDQLIRRQLDRETESELDHLHEYLNNIFKSELLTKRYQVLPLVEDTVTHDRWFPIIVRGVESNLPVYKYKITVSKI